MRTVLLAIALMAVAAPALAAPAPAWTVDRAHSRLGFTANVGGQAVPGEFKRWDAQIAFDPANLPGSRVAVTIEPASAVTGDQTRDEALPTPDWFGVKAFPRASFISRSITAAGGPRYVAHGELTIRNITKPVDLPFVLALSPDKARAVGFFTVDRRTFGLGSGQFSETGLVAAAVKIEVSVLATKAK